MGALCNTATKTQITGKSEPTNKTREQKDSNNTELVINQNMLVKLNNTKGPPIDKYTHQCKLGEGTFGTVEKVIHNESKMIRAMKKISKRRQKNSEAEILNEIEILKKLDHPNIVRIFEIYSSTDNYYLITEFCKEGELYDQIKNFGFFQENEAAYIIYQLLSAILVCHSHNIIHRDLKPENILIDNINNRFLDIKVIDFGTAKIFEHNKTQSKKIGSSYYMAPEVLLQNYNEKCDLWSVGVILYILLSGRVPFGGTDDDEIFTKIKKGEYNLVSKPFDNISTDAKDLIKKLLDKDTNKRPSADKALKHNWFNKCKTKENLFSTAKRNVKEMMTKLTTYSSEFKLQQAAIAFIVHNMAHTDEIREIFSIFQLIDESGDGRITKEELIKGLTIHNPSLQNIKDEVDKIFTNLDTDQNGFIEFEEFARVLIDKKKLLTQENLAFSFNFFEVQKYRI